ncbi:MAG: hypothetical protein U5N86_02180 [Planctomycetota bacterium]|nr:hypothetical protein [Planctomycetota bacterium]
MTWSSTGLSWGSARVALWILNMIDDDRNLVLKPENMESRYRYGERLWLGIRPKRRPCALRTG